jgi:hypothetical protein
MRRERFASSGSRLDIWPDDRRDRQSNVKVTWRATDNAGCPLFTTPTMLEDERIRTLLNEADALQQARARLYQRLDQLTDMCDVRTFADVLADVLADVAALHARQGTKRSAGDWGRLRDALEQFLKANPPARCRRTLHAETGRKGRKRAARLSKLE